jgi:membrane protein DedA with SNARE-associated domain
MPGFLNALAGPLNHYGYWAILALVMIEDFGIPVPGETIMIAGAIYAGHGQLNVVTVGLVAFFAAVIGDNIGFAIGHFGGRELALRWGRYVFLTEERLAKAEHFFERHGGWIISVARFVEGLRQANGIVAGITGMHWRRFIAFNALGAALWVGTWVSLGYLAGNHINTIYHYITQYSLYALIVAVVLVAGYVIRRVLRRRRHRTQQDQISQDQSKENQTNHNQISQDQSELGRTERNGTSQDRSEPGRTERDGTSQDRSEPERTERDGTSQDQTSQDQNGSGRTDQDQTDQADTQQARRVLPGFVALQAD